MESLGLRLHNQAFDSFHHVNMEGKDTPDLSHITHWKHPNTGSSEGLRAYAHHGANDVDDEGSSH